MPHHISKQLIVVKYDAFNFKAFMQWCLSFVGKDYKGCCQSLQQTFHTVEKLSCTVEARPSRPGMGELSPGRSSARHTINFFPLCIVTGYRVVPVASAVVISVLNGTTVGLEYVVYHS